ncbi:MAG: hypothetical protein OEZ06_27380 [Myxococcales bacterium]|nr:hypothetical protein [Myxococcales bacterium]
MTKPLGQALDALAAEGINWVSAVACGTAADSAHLLLLLAMGSRFGERTDFRGGQEHPFDRRSEALVEQLLKPALSDRNATLVYPASEPIDLRSWLALAHAQHPAPFGIGIRPDCGPWVSVRAALRTRLQASELTVIEERYPKLAPDSSPCARCAERPCQAACPAAAVTASAFELDRCIAQRLKKDSPCAYECAARNACPVGRDFRYGAEQMRYHYSVSLATLLRYAGTLSTPPSRQA